MRRPQTWFPILALILGAVWTRAAAVDVARLPPPSTKSIDFAQDVQPIFERHCLSCHGVDKQRGGLRLDDKDSALKGGENHSPDIRPGRSADSPLIHFVAGLVPDMQMPQKGERLTAEQVGILRAWIDQGAAWPATVAKKTHWALSPVTSPVVPHRGRSRSSVDAFILAKLDEKKLALSFPANRRTLIRRLSFDLIGLPPTPDEVERFTNDKSVNAYSDLVERLLASPRYGERWGRHWLDVVRFAESHGFEMNQPRANAWPYRDYVIRSFNENKPYDLFIVEQLAGDALGVDEATGFLVAGSWDQVKSPDPVLTANQRADELHDMVSTTGSAFLGLTVGCARCHNHKFDPIPQTDYFAMKAVFEGVQHGERKLRTPRDSEREQELTQSQLRLVEIEMELEEFEPRARVETIDTNSLRAPVNPRRNVERFEPVPAKRLRFTVNKTTDAEPCIDELEVYVEGPAYRNMARESLGTKASASSVYPNSDIHRIEHVNDGKVGNGRSWISNERGKGWVELEFPGIVRIEKVVWGRDRQQRFTDRLALDYRIEVAMASNDWRVVASSADRQSYAAGKKKIEGASFTGLTPADAARAKELSRERNKLEARISELAKAPMVYGGSFIAKPEPTHRFHRGDPMQKREVVAPGAPTAVAVIFSLTQLAAPTVADNRTEDQRRRLALGAWITNPTNPLTARVMVNRVWQHHFGEGLVSTPSDFGVNGSPPTHPELLDWLASEFVANGWSVKHLHRLIVNTDTYRQSSEANEDGLTVDASSRLLWRYPPRRLDAEPIRDSILAVSGKLDLRAGGPGFSFFEPNDNYVRVYAPRREWPADTFQRMVYGTVVRQRPDGVFGSFDCPDGGQIAPKRSRSTTPLQAFNLLNSSFMMQQAEFLAARLEKEAGRDEKAQVERAFELAFQRQPDRKERAAGVKLIREQGAKIFCRALFNASEFIYVD
jgi:mono/diheme cytochrome c family protein